MFTRAIRELVAEGGLPDGDYPAPIVEDPRNPEHGDYACSVALASAHTTGKNPREVAEMLADRLRRAQDVLAAVEVAGPGFVNLRIQPAWLAERLDGIVAGHQVIPQVTEPSRLNVEFVSVNPNGPITVGSGRGAAYGSVLCNVLEAVGHRVHREYYVNDGTNSEQMRLFAESVRSYLLGTPFPERGYRGDYVEDVAAALAGTSLELTDLVSACERLMTGTQRSDLEAFGVRFDTWASEQALHDSGQVAECANSLVAKGVADEEPFQIEVIRKKNEPARARRVPQGELDEDGPADPMGDDDRSSPTGGEGPATLWLRSTKFDDDKDRVLRRRDGRWTYIASDVAYHRSKFSRGAPYDANGQTEPADRLITILGPDHHGYVGRLTAVVAALLEDLGAVDEAEPVPTSTLSPEAEALIYRSPEEKAACLRALQEARQKLQVVIFQIVRFVKDGKPAPMRKRDGNIYSLRDLMLEIGKEVAPDAALEEQLQAGRDVARFFYLMRSHDTAMDFDIDLATRQSDENPVFYAQYAHARVCSILARARASNLRPASHPDLLSHPREVALMKKVLDFGDEVRRCAAGYEVHRLTTYALELARAFHHFYDACTVVDPEAPELSEARLHLCLAVRRTLRETLDLLGVSSPERMARRSESVEVNG